MRMNIIFLILKSQDKDILKKISLGEAKVVKGEWRTNEIGDFILIFRTASYLGRAKVVKAKK